jgi:hypothetical protein
MGPSAAGPFMAQRQGLQIVLAVTALVFAAESVFLTSGLEGRPGFSRSPIPPPTLNSKSPLARSQPTFSRHAAFYGSTALKNTAPKHPHYIFDPI